MITDIAAWCKHIIEGQAGMNSYEARELVVWHESERFSAAQWVIRCLANPDCEGSGEVLQAIVEQRRIKRSKKEPQ